MIGWIEIRAEHVFYREIAFGNGGREREVGEMRYFAYGSNAEYPGWSHY